MLRNILKHTLLEAPFVTAVSIAALTHSAWSLATFFTGTEPTPQFTPVWFAWLLPGLLIGIAIDIGILSIAIQFRHGNRSKAKFAAFFVLSTAMAYIQFLYLIAHVPNVPIASGVSATWLSIATTLRDLSIWIIPILLPLACLLYAFSDRKSDTQKPPNRDERRAQMMADMTTQTQQMTNGNALTNGNPERITVSQPLATSPVTEKQAVMDLEADTGKKRKRLTTGESQQRPIPPSVDSTPTPPTAQNGTGKFHEGL